MTLRFMIAAACSAALLAGAAQAQDFPRLASTIVVTGQGEAEEPPDSFTLSAQIEAKGADQAEAVANMVRVQTAVTDGVSRLEGLTTAKVTTGLPSIQPILAEDCTPRGRPSGCEVVGYVASIGVTMQGMPAERGGDAVSAAGELGARDARLTGFTLSDDSALQQQAAYEAFADARRQAEAIARAAGQRVTRVVTVEHPRSSDDPFYGAANLIEPRAFEAGLYDFRARTGISINPEAVKVESSLMVTFETE